METTALGRLTAALRTTSEALLEELGSADHWTGELSSSALATATAIVALGLADREAHAEAIEKGLAWVTANSNEDGGWGDTVCSLSNISTTALCWAALAIAPRHVHKDSAERAEDWLKRHCGTPEEADLTPGTLVKAIQLSYGKDRTFSAPIVMTLALAGRLGEDGWKHVPALPFELALLPHRIFSAVGAPVVSYALPALIAIGQAAHQQAPTANPFLKLLRNKAQEATMRTLAQIQPENGGFLEAVPLTSFVTMSLAALGKQSDDVSRKSIRFLQQAARPDGSWPIDSNLATWVTTLAVKALQDAPPALADARKTKICQWLLSQQHRKIHPYTHSNPGGWAWTDLPGGVPDADDTAGALVALHWLDKESTGARAAAWTGAMWLLDLQNADGGIPTFCRGFGSLPFDQSAPDLTAHAIQAWAVWMDGFDRRLQRRLKRGLSKAVQYLKRSQCTDGSWTPLWFGNERDVAQENRTYGTSRVMLGLQEAPPWVEKEGMYSRAEKWLIAAQRPDGSWGGGAEGPSSVEETALALEALAGSRVSTPTEHAVGKGTSWLIDRIESAGWREPAPIGLYFAKLWYFERLYPLIFTTAALGGARRFLARVGS